MYRALLLASALALVGCGSDDEIEPTFTNVVADVLNPSCALAGCHAEGAAQVVLTDAAAYGNLVDQPSVDDPAETLVIPNDSAGSYLVTKIAGSPTVGDLMPPPDGGLAQEDIDLIKAWIDAGALDD